MIENFPNIFKQVQETERQITKTKQGSDTNETNRAALPWYAYE